MEPIGLLPMTAARSKTRGRGGDPPSKRQQPPVDTTNWKLGDYIVAEMRARGIEDQSELGALLGVNQSSVSRWINGESRGPSGDNLRRLAEFLRMPIQELYLVKHRNPGPISATALEREVRELQGEVEELNDKLQKIEALVDVLTRAMGAGQVGPKARRP